MNETRIIELLDSDDNNAAILIAQTNMSEEEISNAVFDETLDKDNYDWEEKLVAHAEMLNKIFKRILIDEAISV